MEILVRPFIGNQEKGQCQLSTDNTIIKDTFVGPSIQNVIVIIFVIALYTAIVLCIGYKRGVRNGQYKIPVEEKMTMTSVTYSYVRGVRHPRFEYCPEYLAGCWP